jgi:hypothetical protein
MRSVHREGGFVLTPQRSALPIRPVRRLSRDSRAYASRNVARSIGTTSHARTVGAHTRSA